ncbi:hypothetical protein MLD38_000951 [Melastoma candidum]|uniref:Uncharacterized protein n=1 Tax=Melastoma candidum TaxID=119954 RepID=A0ACB9SFN3_9MYRT|nr:hypothetical protein MLD38_000951 [Melastoma candidum]
MELARELFLTAVVAVLFSFVVAKLVSVALSSKESVDGSKFRESGGDSVSRGSFVDEVRFFEELRSPPVRRETRVVEAVQEELRTVDRFGDEPLVAEEVVVAEPKACDEEVGLESRMPSDEPSEITEKSSEKEVSGEAEILAGEAVECAVGEKEGRDGKASREANQLHDVEFGVPVVEAGEAADVVVEEEEVVDEDDWEGIERSELEKDFAAAARFVDDRKDRLEAAMGDDTKMQLYGLHKVATEGPCRDSPPMAMKVSARAKWYP